MLFLQAVPEPQNARRVVVLVRTAPVLRLVVLQIGDVYKSQTLFRTYPDAPGLLKGRYIVNGYFGEKALPEPWYNWNSWACLLYTSCSRSRIIRLIPDCE